LIERVREPTLQLETPMIVPLDFGGPDQFVWAGQIAKLSVPVRAAWAAFCVGTVGPLLPPSFHARFPFARCVRAAWDFALGRPFDRDEVERLHERLVYEAAVFGQAGTDDDNPGYWMLVEHYRLTHPSAPGYLLELVLNPDNSEYAAESAVEAAGLVYKDYQFWRQGYHDVADEAYPYVGAVLNMFYDMTQRAHAVALAHAGEPTEEMFAGVEFPADCAPLAPDLAAASRLNPGPTTALQEQWLRETGRWRGPA